MWIFSRIQVFRLLLVILFIIILIGIELEHFLGQTKMMSYRVRKSVRGRLLFDQIVPDCNQSVAS